MAIPNFNRANRVNALSLGDKVGVFSGDADPRTIDTSTFPVGSIYFQTDGTAWKRSGSDSSAWVKLLAEEMVLLNLGMALGADGWAYALNLAGQDNQELMVNDNGSKELLWEILNELRLVRQHLQVMTDEAITKEDLPR